MSRQPAISSRIAMIEPVGAHGGMAPYDLNLCRGISEAGVDVSLYTSENTSSLPDMHFAIRETYRGIFGGAPAWKRGLRFLRGSLASLLAAVLEGRGICHFHFFSVGPLEALNVLLARLLGRAVVITAHDVEAFASHLDAPGLPRVIYGLADKVIAHNQISRSELQSRLALPASRIQVIPHGHYPDCIGEPLDQQEARRRLGLPPDDPVLLFFGQIKEVKGLDLLIEAMPAILQVHPRVHLVIAGRPWKTDITPLVDRIAALGIQDQCLCRFDYIPDQDRATYYRAADLVVLPYRKIYQSGVLLMAMSYGNAVLVSNIPGMTELISHAVNGFVFQSGSPASLAEVAAEALSDASRLQAVSSHGRDMIIRDFSWTSIGKTTRELYSELL